jgi:hypothetical protein
MKLTKAEQELLDSVERVEWTRIPEFEQEQPKSPYPQGTRNLPHFKRSRDA